LRTGDCIRKVTDVSVEEKTAMQKRVDQLQNLAHKTERDLQNKIELQTENKKLKDKLSKLNHKNPEEILERIMDSNTKNGTSVETHSTRLQHVHNKTSCSTKVSSWSICTI